MLNFMLRRLSPPCLVRAAAPLCTTIECGLRWYQTGSYTLQSIINGGFPNILRYGAKDGKQEEMRIGTGHAGATPPFIVHPLLFRETPSRELCFYRLHFRCIKKFQSGIIIVIFWEPRRYYDDSYLFSAISLGGRVSAGGARHFVHLMPMDQRHHSDHPLTRQWARQCPSTRTHIYSYEKSRRDLISPVFATVGGLPQVLYVSPVDHYPWNQRRNRSPCTK